MKTKIILAKLFVTCFGLYNMVDKVAEMVSEKGIAKGGSWHHTKENCRAGKDIPYYKPEA